MKTFSFLKRSLLTIALAMGLTQLMQRSTHAEQTLYFDQNGITAGFGLTSVGTAPNYGPYDWNLTDAVWNTASSGTGGTLSAWDNANKDIAYFNLGGSAPAPAAGSTLAVNLQNNVTVGGVNSISNASVRITAVSAKALTLNTGAIVTVSSGDHSRGLTFGDYVNLIGDLTISQAGSNGWVSINGLGDSYVGTITVNGTNWGGLRIAEGSRTGAQTKVVLNSGTLSPTGTGGGTIGELSGAGGRIAAPQGNTALTIDQSTHSEWAGQLSDGGVGAAGIALTKKGSGRLSLTNTTQRHYINPAMTVAAGSLYLAGELQGNGVQESSAIIVQDGATFGGTSTVLNKLVKLNASGSVLDAGMHELVGTLKLEGGLQAAGGGTFVFKLNGASSSLLDIDGALSLSTEADTKTIHLVNIGLVGNIQWNTVYTLIDASGSTGTWDATLENWILNLDGFGVLEDHAVWSLDNRQLTVAFVPEPSTLLLIGSALSLLLIFQRRNKFNGKS